MLHSTTVLAQDADVHGPSASKDGVEVCTGTTLTLASFDLSSLINEAADKGTMAPCSGLGMTAPILLLVHAMTPHPLQNKAQIAIAQVVQCFLHIATPELVLTVRIRNATRHLYRAVPPVVNLPALLHRPFPPRTPLPSPLGLYHSVGSRERICASM